MSADEYTDTESDVDGDFLAMIKDLFIQGTFQGQFAFGAEEAFLSLGCGRPLFLIRATILRL